MTPKKKNNSDACIRKSRLEEYYLFQYWKTSYSFELDHNTVKKKCEYRVKYPFPVISTWAVTSLKYQQKEWDLSKNI